MAGSQYLVPAMPARAARTSYSGPSRLRIPRVVNLRHGYTNARRRRLQTIFSSQPVNPSRNHQPPRWRKQLHETEHSYHALTHHHFTPLSDSRRGSARHAFPIGDMSNRRRGGRGIQSLNHRACGVHSPLPGAIQHPAWSTPSPQKKKPEIGMREEKMGNSRRRTTTVSPPDARSRSASRCVLPARCEQRPRSETSNHMDI